MRKTRRRARRPLSAVTRRAVSARVTAAPVRTSRRDVLCRRAVRRTVLWRCPANGCTSSRLPPPTPARCRSFCVQIWRAAQKWALVVVVSPAPLLASSLTLPCPPRAKAPRELRPFPASRFVCTAAVSRPPVFYSNSVPLASGSPFVSRCVDFAFLRFTVLSFTSPSV